VVFNIHTLLFPLIGKGCKVCVKIEIVMLKCSQDRNPEKDEEDIVNKILALKACPIKTNLVINVTQVYGQLVSIPEISDITLVVRYYLEV